VREFRVVPAVLVGKRKDEIPIARITALTKAGRDFGFDTIHDLRVERHIIVRKIDIPLEQARLRDDGQSKKEDEDSEKRIDAPDRVPKATAIRGGASGLCELNFNQ
jgi:hypothetical protein